MKTALIIGINGNFGSYMGKALQKQGWHIRALLRDAAKAPTWIDADSITIGQAQDEPKVRQAAEGVDLLVYAANPPYHRWSQDAMAMLEPAVRVAEQMGLQLVFPGNVYVFSPQVTPISEQVEMHPPTEKGLIRQRMEARLYRASQQGARVMIVRAGDFIGPDTAWTWLQMIARYKDGLIHMKQPHDRSHVHYWSYLPDLCANTVTLLEQQPDDWTVYHDPGLTLGEDDWRKACRALGVPLKVTRFPWWMVNMAVPFSPMVREVRKMRYLWQQPVVMDGSRMVRQLGADLQATPLTSVIEQTLLAMTTTQPSGQPA